MMHIYFVSLGCDKNLVDSEKMLALLTKEGYELTDEPEQAEIIVVNTCAFIHDAKQESIETLLELAEYKKTGKCKVLIASGCLAERYQDTILEEMPEIDGVIGTTAYDDIAVVVKKALGGEHAALTKELDYLPVHLTDRVTSGMSHVGYLKISEGCNKNCTYCIIPSMRGHYRSVPMEDLIEEAEKLAEKGIRELILVAQETTLYGVDLYHEKKLPELLRRLSEIRDISWIRVLYCYPEEITVELAQELRDNPKVCHYLDLPIQHCNDEVLKRMGRRTTKAELLDIIHTLRSEIPDIVLRTTLITGFPGETEEQHEELMDFVDEVEFERLGVFAYSPEEDTPAAVMPDQIPEEIKQKRRNELMELQQDIAFEKAENMVGRELLAMVEGEVSGESAYVARTYGDAPNVDGYLFINTAETLVSGDFARVKVTGALEYDLIGELAE